MITAGGSCILECPRCGSSLVPSSPAPAALTQCPECTGRGELTTWIYPAALIQSTAPAFAETVQDDGEATCFYHDANRAAVSCQACGRFVCSLCDIALNDGHLCPQCVHSGQRKGKIAQIENQRIFYDQIAFFATFGGLLFWPVTLLTAPYALYLIYRHWNTPLGIIKPHRKWVFVLAGCTAVAEIVGWIALLAVLLL